MIKWEYDVVTLQDGKYKESLDFWGSKGWELAGTDGKFFYLKRPIFEIPDFSPEITPACCSLEEIEERVANAIRKDLG